jgi:tripartite-type tricarboxylate transporter receptor subunit TctC
MQQDRSPLLPDVPTFREATGIDNIAAPAWFAFLAPGTVPADIRERLERAILQAVADSGVRSKLTAAGLDVIAVPSAQFKEIIRTESAYNARTIRRLGYKPD